MGIPGLILLCGAQLTQTSVCCSSLNNLHLQSYLMAPDGCSSSSHHITFQPAVGRTKKKRSEGLLLPSLSRFPKAATGPHRLHLSNQNSVMWLPSVAVQALF